MRTAPLEVEIAHVGVTEARADVILVPFTADGAPGPGTAEVLAAAGLDLPGAIASAGIAPQAGSVIRVPAGERLDARAVALVCVPSATPDAFELHQAAGAAGQACRDAARLATTLHQLGGESEEAIAAVADGLAWGRYEFLDYKSRRPDGERMRHVTLLSATPGARLAAGLDTGVRIAAGDWVRDLVNTPACHATPAAIAAEAARLASRANVSCRVWNVEDLAAARMNGIVAVGAGSANAPCMVELRYESGEGPNAALVGKGVTFDAGGLDVKNVRSMVEMKNDMAGAASVIAATWVAAELGLKVNIVTLAPLAENMPSGTALRPSDVITHLDGSTTEIMSPDGEGRLILAEALAHLADSDFDAIVDVATLTGSTGLGSELWALLGNDADLVASLLDAGVRSGDPGWELPLRHSYDWLIESRVADRINNGWKGGSFRPDTMVGALYLSQFVKGRPWAHIDNGATAEWASDAVGPGTPVGPTGSPTGALIAWLESLSAQ